MVQMFPLINILNWTLTGGKNNHKIKIAETGQLAVGIRPWTANILLSFPKILTTPPSRGVKEGGGW